MSSEPQVETLTRASQRPVLHANGIAALGIRNPAPPAEICQTVSESVSRAGAGVLHRIIAIISQVALREEAQRGEAGVMPACRATSATSTVRFP
jgi:hypothetical protein